MATNQILFEDAEFPSLILAEGEFLPGFNSVPLDLLEDESDIFSTLLAGCSDGNADLDLDDVLLVKVSKHGDIDRVYAPSVGRVDEDGKPTIVQLKVGSNVFPVELENNVFKVGSLTGFFSAEPKARRWTDKDGVEKEFTPCFITFGSPNYPYEWRVNLKLAEDVTPSAFQRAAASASNILDVLDYLGPLGGGGGGGALKIQELCEGDTLPKAFKVTGIREVEGKYGKSHVLKLADGREAWSRGTAAKQLNAGFEGRFPLPWNLLVNEVTKLANGKFRVSCRLTKFAADSSAGAIEASTEPKETAPLSLEKIPF